MLGASTFVGESEFRIRLWVLFPGFIRSGSEGLQDIPAFHVKRIILLSFLALL